MASLAARPHHPLYGPGPLQPYYHAESLLHHPHPLTALLRHPMSHMMPPPSGPATAPTPPSSAPAPPSTSPHSGLS